MKMSMKIKPMNNKKIVLISVFTLLLSGFAIPASAITGNLLGMLTSQLGINEQQATQGMAALMDLAKQHLSTTDYTKLLSGAPDLGTLSKAAEAFAKPQVATITGSLLGYAASYLGGDSANQMAQMVHTFAQWGLTADMVSKFLKIALDYVNIVGGPDLMKILSGALQF